MNEENEKKYWVTYEEVDNAHFFALPEFGLFVGHSDLKQAFEEVSIQLAQLIKDNLRQEVASVVPEISFDEFRAWTESMRVPPTPSIRPRLMGDIAWSDSLMPAVA